MMHHNKNGYIPISSMTDSHLLNMIKLPFKQFAHADNEMLAFMLGKSFEKLTPETFNKIILKNPFYILEGLRRDSTREAVLSFLASINPIWASRQQELIPYDVDKQLNPGKYVDKSVVEDEEDDDEDYYDTY